MLHFRFKIFQFFFFFLMVALAHGQCVVTATVSQINASCFGGSDGEATATGAGGLAPYTYSWNTSPVQTTATATGLFAGTYTVSVTDANNCLKTATVTITQPTVLTATTIQNSPVKCKGESNGSATVAVIGGTPQYSYSWDKSIATIATATDLAVGTHTITITDANNCVVTVTVTITEPTVLTATAIQNSPVKCKGESNGVATVTAVGGTPQYSYSWNKSSSTSASASDLAAGIHTVTIKDANNCETKAFVTITEPTTILSATAIQNSSVNCFGGSDGSATVTASGGTSPYTYIWQNSSSAINTATDLTAGVHNITIKDANGCETSTIVLINQPTVLTATAVQYKSVVCNGASNGSATVTAIGGTLPYTYSWNKSSSISAVAADLAAGIHTVTVKDKNGCEIKANVVITEPDVLTVTVIKNIPVKCNGKRNGEATVTVEGGTAPYSYVWQNSASTTNTATDLSAGTHSITVKDANGCIKIISVIITEPALLSATAIQNSPVKCKGESNGSATVTAIGGTTPYTYYWDNKTASSATATDLAVGSHTVKVIDGNGCETTTTVTITEPTVLTATATQNSPVQCKGASNGAATVKAVGGTPPYIYSWDKSASSTDVATDLSAGLHTITIRDANDCITTATVMISELVTLTATAVQLKSVTCNGRKDGSATVTATGGKLPYTYSWGSSSLSTNATASDLSAGTHTITIKDANNCETTVTVQITEPAALSATVIINNMVKCKGEYNGSATVVPIGGTPPYTYSWDKSNTKSITASDLAAGLHTITVRDANNCVTTATIVLTEPNILTLTQNVLPITCSIGGSISVLVTGGVSTNYFYAWEGPSSFSQSGFNLKSITNLLNGGTYKLTVTDDNGCAIIKFFTLEAYVPLEYVGTTAIEFDTCDNNPTFGIAIIDIRGGVPYRDGNGNPYYYFEWFGPNNYHSNEAIIPIAPGNYTCIISDSVNCKSNPISFTITTPYAPITVSNIIGNVSCDSESADGYIAVSVNGGKIPYSILWERETPGSATGNPNPTYNEIGRNILRVNNLTEGRYRLTVTSNLFSCSDSNPAYKFQTIYVVSAQNSIRILEAPVLDDNLCAGKTGTLKVKVIDDNDGSVSFYYNGLLANADDLGNNQYLVYINNFVTDGVLNTVNEFGCGETVIIAISVAEPSFEISSVGYNLNGVININEEVTFRNTSTQPYSRLEWDFGDGSDLSEEESPVHSFAVSGIRDVTLRIYNDLGCYKEVTEKISVGKGYLAMFPDIFTPNNDGLNDYFQGELIGFESFEFEIYDLWNNLLFSTATNVTSANVWGWDGNLSDGTPFNGKIFKYVFKGIDNFGKEVIVSNQALLLR